MHNPEPDAMGEPEKGKVGLLPFVGGCLRDGPSDPAPPQHSALA